MRYLFGLRWTACLLVVGGTVAAAATGAPAHGDVFAGRADELRSLVGGGLYECQPVGTAQDCTTAFNYACVNGTKACSPCGTAPTQCTLGQCEQNPNVRICVWEPRETCTGGNFECGKAPIGLCAWQMTVMQNDPACAGQGDISYTCTYAGCTGGSGELTCKVFACGF